MGNIKKIQLFDTFEQASTEADNYNLANHYNNYEAYKRTGKHIALLYYYPQEYKKDGNVKYAVAFECFDLDTMPHERLFGYVKEGY